jgi:transitional endoplasmic reticulum ATPase
MQAFEAAMLACYARNVFTRVALKGRHMRRGGGALLECLAWLATYASVLKVPDAVFANLLEGVPETDNMSRKASPGQAIVQALQLDDEERSFGLDESATRITVHHARKALRQWVREPTPPLPSRLSFLERRIQSVAQVLDLNGPARDVIGLLMRLNTLPALHELLQGLFKSDWDRDFNPATRNDMRWADIGDVLGLNSSIMARVRASDSPLRRLGLVSPCQQDAELETSILKLAHHDPKTAKLPVIAALMGRQCRQSEAMTDWSDFAHLGPAREMALSLVKGALKTKAKGVVILLHGPPGTGKTAFAQTLIAQAGAKGWMVGETDEAGDEASRRNRMSSLLLASALSGNSTDNVLILDEADDVFNDGAAGFMAMFAPSRVRDGSKVFMNRALEDLQAPTIMIVNDAGNLGEAIVRRMSLAIEIKTPNAQVAARIASRVLARQKLSASPEALLALAEGGTPPAVMALAARAAKLSGGGAAHLKLAARSVTRMQDVEARPYASDLAGMGFDPAFANADCDLAHLADAAVSCGNRALSFCLYGAPGTGKSAFARWIAGRMGLEVIEKRASDLLGMYVGESEKNIARAFEDAADKEAFLIFDEADSLLADRTNARRSWEVSQVNEMLTWMERHPLPFAATTNLMKGLDPAALRRFLFKAEFRPLQPSQAFALFAHTFGCEAPATLANLDLLTPGDIAVVSRKASVLGLSDPIILVEALQAEVAHKPGAGKVKVGF